MQLTGVCFEPNLLFLKRNILIFSRFLSLENSFGNRAKNSLNKTVYSETIKIHYIKIQISSECDEIYLFCIEFRKCIFTWAWDSSQNDALAISTATKLTTNKQINE